jgi:hypothetical protein
VGSSDEIGDAKFPGVMVSGVVGDGDTESVSGLKSRHLYLIVPIMDT